MRLQPSAAVLGCETTAESYFSVLQFHLLHVMDASLRFTHTVAAKLLILDVLLPYRLKKRGTSTMCKRMTFCSSSAVSFRPSRYQPDVKVRPLPRVTVPEQRHLCVRRHGVLPLHLPVRLQGESHRKCFPHIDKTISKPQ